MQSSSTARQKTLRQLYYITHIDNLDSIIKNGILSHSLIEEKKIPFTPIYDKEIVNNRKQNQTPAGKTLWDYANLYFQPRNPMLYRVISEKSRNDIAVVGVKKSVLENNGIFLTDGNAANNETNFFPIDKTKQILPKILKEVNKEWWSSLDGSKRKVMAECLVPDAVKSDYIEEIIVSNSEVADKVRAKLGDNFDVVTHSYMFFEPEWKISITDNLSIIEGDMFFSQMQTLTISVNVVGVMGKGLASRAKYQFPDVYVKYQDVCRSKALDMGKPYLYRRELSDYEIADDPSSLSVATWFLLFATKRHWREQADIRAIEEGLKWIVDNYKNYEMTSLASPALGCGLGRLDWREVGPLMCKYLSKLQIPVQIYLPAEKRVPKNQTTKEFLLPKERLD